MFCSDSSLQDLGLLTYEQNKQKTQKRVKNISFKKEKQEKEKKKKKKKERKRTIKCKQHVKLSCFHKTSLV